MTKGFVQRFFVFRNYLIVATLGILVLTFFAKQYAFFPFDLYLTKLIQQINIPVIEMLLLFLSWIGNPFQVVMSLIIFPAALFIYGKKKESLMLLVSAVGAVAISEVLKIIVLRPRPDGNLIHQVESFYRNDSFPSGHVLYFIGFFGFLMFLSFTLIRKKFWRNLISGILLLMLIMIGVSRIYLGSHWFSDTLASYLIGSIWLYFMVLLFRKYQLK